MEEVAEIEEQYSRFLVAEDDAEYFNKSPFIYVRSSGHAVGLTWEEANEYCYETYSTQLATINSYQDWSCVLDLFDMDSSYTAAWIGLNDVDNDGTFEWTTLNYFDTPITLSTWSNWSSGEPNGGTNENCVESNYYKEWNDLDCDRELWGFVCNYEYTAVENGTCICILIMILDLCHVFRAVFCFFVLLFFFFFYDR